MAIALRGSATFANNSEGSTSTVVISAPTGLATGDTLIASFSVDGGTGVTITPPAGWSLIKRTNVGVALAHAGYSKVAGGSEPGSYTFTVGATSAAGGLAAYSGVDNTTPIEVTGTASTSTGSTSASAPSITTTTATDQLLVLYGIYDGLQNPTTPSTFTKQYRQVSGTSNVLEVLCYDKALSSAGATGAVAVTLSASDVWVAFQIALKPATGGVVSSSGTTVGGDTAFTASGGGVVSSSGTTVGGDTAFTASGGLSGTITSSGVTLGGDTTFASSGTTTSQLAAAPISGVGLAPVILADNPIFLLKLNDATAPFADATGRGFTGATVGTVTPALAGPMVYDGCMAAQTGGGFANYINIPLSANGLTLPTGNAPWTIEIAALAPPGASGSDSFGFGTSAAHQQVQLNADTANARWRASFFDAFIDGPNGSLVPNSWAHILIRYDGAIASLTINGAVIGTLPITLNLGNTFCRVGYRLANGQYSHAALYNYALNDAQAETHYAAFVASQTLPAAVPIVTKQQIVKVYSSAGKYLDCWRDAPLLGQSGAQGPKFAVNNITGQITVTLPRSFDSFDEGGDNTGRGTITAGNIVQFWVCDNGTLTAGRMVFQGYIDGYQPAIDDSSAETIQVTLTPWDTVLGDVQYYGTQTFGTSGSPGTYVDPVQMFNWVFGLLVAATSTTAVTAGTTTALTLTNVTNILPGSTLSLQGTGADSAKVNGPLTVASVAGSVVTFTAAIPTNSYSNSIIVGNMAPTTSSTAVTGGVTQSLTVANVSLLVVGMAVGIVGTGTDSGKRETAAINSILGSTVTFAAPLTNSYSATIGMAPAQGNNITTSQASYTYPLTLDPANPTSSGTAYMAKLHNTSISSWFETVRTIAPNGWFWRVNPTKTVTFASTPTTAKHTFIIGKHLAHPQYQKNFTTLKNDIIVVGTGVSARVTGTDVAVYGQRTMVVVEERLVDSATATRYANSLLNQYDRVDYRSLITVVDSRGDTAGIGYDIESIMAGDTCRLEDPQRNQKVTLWDHAVWDTDSWDFPAGAQINQVVAIAGLTYNFDTVDIELATLQPSQDKFIAELGDQVASSQFN